MYTCIKYIRIKKKTILLLKINQRLKEQNLLIEKKKEILIEIMALKKLIE